MNRAIGLPDLFESCLARQQPFHWLAEMLRNPQENLCTDFALPFFVTGQLPLANPKLPGKVRLARIKAPQFA